MKLAGKIAVNTNFLFLLNTYIFLKLYIFFNILENSVIICYVKSEKIKIMFTIQWSQNCVYYIHLYNNGFYWYKTIFIGLKQSNNNNKFDKIHRATKLVQS